ncbi:DUF6207 family protein [Streptomyces sp. E2N166]|uniref:DUF6207 family protein n=1 Tax=Streptomyces sp. E2N166 TaxID=1851909 RepID=UPI0031F64CD8
MSRWSAAREQRVVPAVSTARDQAAGGQHVRLAIHVRVMLAGRKNLGMRRSVEPGMRPINDGHVVGPGLAVVEVAAADDETAFAVQELLATRWALAPADRTTHEPGEPGVRLRCFLDLRQRPGP